MRHALACVPARADLALFAYEEGDRIAGWASAGRAWWRHDPRHGAVTVAVDPERRETLVARPDEHGYVFDLRLQGPAETVFLSYPRHAH